MNEWGVDRSTLIRNVVILGDFVLLNIGMALAYYLLPADKTISNVQALRFYMVLANLCYIPAIMSFNVILHHRIVRPEQIVSRIFGSVGMHIGLFLTIISFLKLDYIPRTYLVVFYSLFFSLLLCWRLSLRVAVKSHRKKGQNLRQVLLIGGGANMQELYDTMSDETYGYQVRAAFFRRWGKLDATQQAYKEELDRMWHWLQSHHVQEVYCGLPSVCREDVLKIIRYCENHMIRYYSVPNVRNYVKRKLKLTLLKDVPVLSIRREPLQDSGNRLIKRAFDLVFSSFFLVVFFPVLYILVGIVIKTSSPGPIFFKQARTGMDGKEFMCYKFRSMKVNQDADKVQATLNDPRKTRFGNFLRKSNLDELPQFINVFKGEMSIVGPRPHMLKHTDEYSQLIDKYMMRHLVKPGITGWAQVTGFRGETKELSQMEGRVERDIWYIENWTFLLDLRIIVKTITNMLGGEKNAY